MNKNLKYVIIAIVAFVAILAILMHNKTQIKAAENIEKIDAYPVNVDTVSSKNLTDHLNLVGTIQANNDVPIVSEAQGKVTKVFAQVGDFKKSGSMLLQLEGDVELAAFKTAEVNYHKAQKDYERYQALFAEKSVTDSQLETAKLALQTAEAQYVNSKKAYEDTKIVTPISGIVSSRTVDLGDYIQKNNTIAEVVDIATLKAMINVSEKDVFDLKTGDKVQITTDIYPGVTFTGKIKTISSKGDAAHTYPVEVDLSNSKEHPLKAGMFAHITFNPVSGSNALVIPRDALLGSIKDAQVYVVDGGVAKLRNLVIGNSSNSSLEVISGLQQGDIVVITGQNNLKENYKVKIVR
ncbi:MAG: efflux RND transporter periplasmic adaptor subunit [Ignavibacteriaceae bacterium]|nr:efflux RND transporter periplasmic adaptor subunit [Ignavibacteriaceae bacterium]